MYWVGRQNELGRWTQEAGYADGGWPDIITMFWDLRYVPQSGQLFTAW